MSANILGPEWNLSPDGIISVTDNGAIKDSKIALKKALDSDLKVIGRPALANELSKSRIGKIVLQIQKIRNISAPKAKEESQAAPRMLKLTLTDGESYVQAIEISPITNISREKTAPGTKVLINGAIYVSNYLLVDNDNFNILGGQVEHLYEKWMLAKSIQQSHQIAFNEGAPPWVPFGHRLVTANQEQTFKSLEKAKDDTNTEFDQQRKVAIAEASTGAVKKTFGGRVKQNVQPVQNSQNNRGKFNDNDRGRRGKFDSKEDAEMPLKPSEKVSLFSFLEDKLPVSKTPAIAPSKTESYPQKDSRNQQNNKRFSKPLPLSASKTSGPDVKSTNLPQKHVQNSYVPQSNDNTRYNPKYSKEQSSNANRQQYQRNNYKNSNNESSYQQKNSGDRQNFSGNNENHFTQPNKNSQPQRQNYSRNDQPTGPAVNGFQQQNSQSNMDSNMHQLANNLSKMSVSNEFASRSLRQHLNLGPSKKPEETKSNDLHVGEQCVAKYWEDGKFYPATIAAVTDKTYAVQFKGYGNIEEVLKQDCFLSNNSYNHQVNRNHNSNNLSGGSMEFRSRRGPPRS